ncbi:YdcH family protein [Malaciobacter mytili]|uniref:DUF465 domain-containing protein n=1 Tax=Malaciobacter mytili LMG 24559 TaxID=1032238 RepID=A0AAX2AGD6_9BACT|nr:DUF465 domain-containing protein [Malaciobacter mytili]AXH15516.1 DUF465 domain-containing protein [Malaciobacter mytili LMG 24559]RXI47056.1 hypothetical protein CRU99_02535 [Malaciobacter mytili]RXK15199.1 hypothetical protein CP985_09930 [Malaciobacter mytili LMG 24559]
MFHEHRDVITKLKQENAHFHKIFEKHNELDDEIVEMEKSLADQFEIEKKKKEKLKIKDEIYSMIMDYKNN